MADYTDRILNGAMPGDLPVIEFRSVKLVVNKPVVTGEVDYGQLDRPTVLRNHPEQTRTAKSHEGNLDYLDIPAFLRRQAD